MASDADRLRAQRLYVESETPQSDSALARACGIDRQTAKRWREAASWEVERAEFWRRVTNAATESAIVATESARQTASLLTAIRRRELLALCAEDGDAKWHERIAAIKADADLDPAIPPEGVLDAFIASEPAVIYPEPTTTTIDYAALDPAQLVSLYRSQARLVEEVPE